MTSFNIDELNKAIESLKSIQVPLFESEELDNFMKDNKDISKVMFVTALDSMKDIRTLPTKYGALNVRYSNYIPRDKSLFIREPDLSEMFKPDFKMKESEKE